MMELNVVLGDLMMFIRDYDDLSKPRPIKRELANLFDDLYLKPEPYGLVLIYGAWNYPLSLVAQPLIGAMATGTLIRTFWEPLNVVGILETLQHCGYFMGTLERCENLTTLWEPYNG